MIFGLESKRFSHAHEEKWGTIARPTAVRVRVGRSTTIDDLGGMVDRDSRSTGWHQLAKATPQNAWLFLGHYHSVLVSTLFVADLSAELHQSFPWTDLLPDFIVCGAWQSGKKVTIAHYSLVYLLAHLLTSLGSPSPSAFDDVCGAQGRLGAWGSATSLAPHLARPAQDVGLLPALMTFTLLLPAFGGAPKIRNTSKENPGSSTVPARWA